ncbi:MAG: PDZ domain-containing protein, partial [Gammaproteobacteria bacterium]
ALRAMEARTQAAAEAAEARREALEEAAAAQEQALLMAEKEQREALEAVEAARLELERQARARERIAAERQEDAERLAEEREEALLAREAVQRELQKAHDNLRRASREVARVHAEVNRAAAPLAAREFQVRDRAVIGVILGADGGTSVEVLGVSPDGPAERAGVAPGDRIVAVMGKPLAGSDAPAQQVLMEALAGIESGDEVTLTLERDGELRDVAVRAEKREPFTWHSYARLPSVPGAGEREIIVERIELPQIDREALEREMSRLHEELERTRVLIQRDGEAVAPGVEQEWVFEFEEFSDLGDAVLSGTNIWIGMPLTRGLRMTELGARLGDYFGTDRGVLVLEAADDNALGLQPGDVVQRVDGREVRTPADLMRALRDLEAGAEVELSIRRQQQDESVTVVVPEHRLGLNFLPGPAPEGLGLLELITPTVPAPAPDP